MGGTAYTISRAAALAGTSPATVEGFLRVMPTAAIKAQGQRVVTENGLTLLKAYVRGITQERAGIDEEAAAAAATAGARIPGEDDPYWSDAAINARAKAIADELRGANRDPSFPQSVGGIRIPDGR